MPQSLQQRVVAALSPAPVWTKEDLILWRPFDAAPVVYYVRFLGEVACKVNAQGPHDAGLVETMLREITPGDLPQGQGEPLATFAPSRTLVATPFTLRVIVSPSLLNGALSKTTDFMAPSTYTAFPAHRCEFPEGDTRDELAFRLAKVVRWSNWAREPAPAISARFHRLKSGVKSTGGKRMGVFPLATIEKTLEFLAKEDGFMELQNFERKQVRIEHADGRFVVNTGRGEPLQLPDGGIVAWVKAFVTRGLDAPTGAG